MKIEVEVRRVYGVAKIYPANEAASLVTALTGTKTFSVSNLNALRGLGHEVVEVNPSKLGALK